MINIIYKFKILKKKFCWCKIIILIFDIQMNKFFIAGGFAAVALAAKLAYEKFFNKPEIVPKEMVIKKLIDTK